MNERIKEIERQCWQSTNTEPYALFDVKKFAELIVRECLSICDEVQCQYGQYTFTATTVKDRVIQHFGVEE